MIYLWKEKMELEEVSWLSREKSRMVHLHKQHSTREDLTSILLHLGLRIHHSIWTRVEYFLEFLVKTNKFLIKNTWETLTHILEWWYLIRAWTRYAFLSENEQKIFVRCNVKTYISRRCTIVLLITVFQSLLSFIVQIHLWRYLHVFCC